MELSQLAQQQRGPQKRSASLANIHSQKSVPTTTTHITSFGSGAHVSVGGSLVGTSLPNLADCGILHIFISGERINIK